MTPEYKKKNDFVKRHDKWDSNDTKESNNNTCGPFNRLYFLSPG